MKRKKRPDVLEGAPLLFAPENELGVVFIFAHLAKRWRLRVGEISAAFPDCIAYQKVAGGEKELRIEFEYKSRNFKTHQHPAKKCDWIVCWEHNWPDAPENLNIVELRREFGLGFNVWIMPVQPDNAKDLKAHSREPKWSVPGQTHKGDLVLFYVTKPEMCLRFVYQAEDRATLQKPDWSRAERDLMAPIRKICELKAPVFYEDLKRHRILKTSGFVRSRMLGRHNAMEYWPYLYDTIVRRNPSAKGNLSKFAPEQL